MLLHLEQLLKSKHADEIQLARARASARANAAAIKKARQRRAMNRHVTRNGNTDRAAGTPCPGGGREPAAQRW